MATLTVTPNPATTSQVVSVAGSGFANAKTRLLLDGVGAPTNVFRPSRSGTFTVGITVSATAKTQTLIAQQLASKNRWTTVASTSIVVEEAVVDPPTETVVTLAAGASAASFLAAVADMSVDVIRLGAGTYAWRNLSIDVDRTARPLTIYPSGDVIFDGTGGGGFIQFGGASKAAYITLDPTGGSFRLQYYALTDTGIIWTGYVDHLTANRFVVRHCSDTAQNGSNTHCVYVSTDGTHRGQDITFNDWDHISGDGFINNFQVSHTPGAIRVTAKGWKTDGGQYGATIGYDATVVLIDGWTLHNNLRPISVGTVWELDPPQTPSGTVRNCVATNCGPPLITAPFTDGGGNTWG